MLWRISFSDDREGQKVAAQRRSSSTFDNVHRGGYVLVDSDKAPELILIATGSEVAITAEAAQTLPKQPALPAPACRVE